MVSPSKKSRKVFGQFIKDKRADTLLPMIDHLASPNAVVTTDGHATYSSLGDNVRIDVDHQVIDHKKCFVCVGIHANNVEGMHGVLKREMRRRIWYHSATDIRLAQLGS